MAAGRALDDFDMRQADVAVDVLPGGQLGVQLRYVTYGEEIGADDYDAALTMIYWRQRFGEPR